MKKLKLITLLTVSSLVLVSCKSTTTSTTPTEMPTTEVTATPTEEAISEQSYLDDVISCIYNPSILKAIPLETTDNIKYCTIFGSSEDSFDSISNSVLSDTCLLVLSQSVNNDIGYLLTNFPEETMFKSLFSGLFGLEENADITYKLDSDNVVSCSIVLEDSTICQAKFLAMTKESNEYFLTVLASRLLPNESEEYSNAIKTCYDSIKYIGSDNLLVIFPSSTKPTQESTIDELEKEISESLEAEQITTGTLLDSITSIHNKVELQEIRAKDTIMLNIYIYLDKETPEKESSEFFSIINEICQSCNLEDDYNSISFQMFVDDTFVAYLIYSNYKDSKTFSCDPPSVSIQEYKTILEELYYKFNSSNDITEKYNKSLDDLKVQYNLD